MSYTSRTILKNALLLNPVHPNMLDLKRCQIVIEGSKVKVIVKNETDLAEYLPCSDIIDMSGYLVLPGFINMHAHLRPLRAFGDGLGLKDWHDRIAESFTKKVSEEDAYYGAALSFGEMLKNGVTSVLSFCTHFEAERQAAIDTGIRAILVPAANSWENLSPAIRVLKNENNGDRVTTWLGVELATRCGTELLQKISKAAKDFDTGLHTHFSEAERQDTGHLLAGGFLDHYPLVLAHCIQVNEKDIGEFKKYGVCVAHNPKSNARLGNGVAPVPDYLAEGINVGIGTDGPLSTFSLSFLEELRTAVLMQRACRQNPALLTTAQVLNMATIMSAVGLNLGGMLGSIEPGKEADLTAVNLKSLHLTPHVFLDGESYVSNIPDMVVHTVKQSDVDLVMVAGQIVLAEGRLKLLEERKILAEVQERSTAIVKNLDGFKKCQ